jgi:hypothetical protein
MKRAPDEPRAQPRGLREILIEAANAIADAIEGKRAAQGPKATSDHSGMSEIDERNERIRQAYMERASGDQRELESWAKKRALTNEERAALCLLRAGYRLMPDPREKLKLTTPLRIREKGVGVPPSGRKKTR